MIFLSDISIIKFFFILKANKCLDSLLEGAKLPMISLEHSSLSKIFSTNLRTKYPVVVVVVAIVSPVYP